MAITLPAIAGTCGVVGCDHAADFETTTQVAPSTWTVSRTCFEHARPEQLAAMLAAAEE